MFKLISVTLLFQLLQCYVVMMNTFLTHSLNNNKQFLFITISYYTYLTFMYEAKSRNIGRLLIKINTEK
jgi:hypothetical protein